MPWQKGQSGNPAGRPKKENTLAMVMQEYLDAKPQEGGETRMQTLVAKIYALAVIDGEVPAAKLILDRLWPLTSVNVNVDGGQLNKEEIGKRLDVSFRQLTDRLSTMKVKPLRLPHAKRNGKTNS